MSSRFIVIAAMLLLSACGKSDLTPATFVNAPTGLGINGFDPVTYHSTGKATQGSANNQSLFQGVVYQFATAENQSMFEANPERYLPAYGGYCAYAMSNGDIVDINPRNWAVVDGQLYLNANIVAQGLWSLNPPERIAKANKRWQDLKTAAVSRSIPADKR